MVGGFIEETKGDGGGGSRIGVIEGGGISDGFPAV